MSRDDDQTAATKREGVLPTRTAVDPVPAKGEERLAAGTSVGRYIVQDVLGAGGMGVVYAAFDPELDRKVAIKLLQARPGGSESGGQTWLVREAQAMARLSHPNVVTVHDVGAMPGDRVFVAMELVEGITLREWMKGGHAWRESLAVMRAAGEGLAAAHNAGLVHRDFKPDNVLVGNDGRTRVMDFGLARLHGDESPAARTSDLQLEAKSPLSERLTATGAVLGTPAYMAPEIYRGTGSDARADQFAYGVALYEALYRARPFDRQALVEGRATAPKPPASAKVPAWVERVVLRAISLDPAQRYSSMDALLAELSADPSATRRRIALGAGVAVALGAAGVLALRGGGGTDAGELCVGAETQLAGTWDAAARTRLETAFRKLDKPFVDEAIKATEKTLDAYAADWVTARNDACKATRVAGYETEDMLALRMQCLDVRLVELKSLAQLFANADAPLVQGAVTAAKKLSAIADCADVPRLMAPDPLPKDPEARDRATKIQAKLAEARTIYKASRPKDAASIIAPLADEVAKLDHKPTLALFHFLHGQTLWVLEGADKGEPELQKAAFAASAGKADELEIEAWLQLANLAIERTKFDVAKERWSHAAAKASRLPGRWEIEVRVLSTSALLDLRQSKHADAQKTMAKARAIADRHPESPTYAYTLLIEATVLNASAKPKEALEDFRKVLDYQDKHGHNRLEISATLQAMATAEAQLGNIAEAIELSQRGVEITESIYGAESIEVARALGTLAAAQSMNNDHATALATNQRVLALAKRLVGENEQLYATALFQIAVSQIALGRAKDAIEPLQRAEAILTAKLGAGHIETLSVVLTRCDALAAVDQLRAAVAVCARTLAAGEQTLGKNNPLLFVILGHYGEVLYKAKQSRKAAEILERALKLGAPDPSDVYFVAMLAARSHWAANNKKRAVELAKKARDGFATLGDAKRDQLRDADAWLAKHER